MGSDTAWQLSRIYRLLDEHLNPPEEPTTFPLTGGCDSITTNRSFTGGVSAVWQELTGSQEGSEPAMVDITFIYKAINAIEELGTDKLTKGNITVYKVGDSIIRIDIKKE